MNPKPSSVPEKGGSKNISEAASCTAITQNVSNLRLAVLEKEELCKLIKDKYKDLKKKAERLASIKCDKLTVRDELRARNKTNATNLECLLQTKHELEKLRGDLKAEYIMAHEATKSRLAKYKTTVSYFQARWEATEAKYKEFPDEVDYVNTQKLNKELGEECENVKVLFKLTQDQYLDLFQQYKEKVQQELIQFAEEAVKYEKRQQVKMKCDEQEKALRALEDEINKLEILEKGKGNPHANLFKTKFEISETKIKSSNYEAVDISAFDDISIPSENLEVNNDEDLFDFPDQVDKNVDNECQSILQLSDMLSECESEGSRSQPTITRCDSQYVSPTQNMQGSAESAWNSQRQSQSQVGSQEHVVERLIPSIDVECKGNAEERPSKRPAQFGETEQFVNDTTSHPKKMKAIEEYESVQNENPYENEEYSNDIHGDKIRPELHNDEMPNATQNDMEDRTQNDEIQNNELQSFEYEGGLYGGSPVQSPFCPLQTSTVMSPTDNYDMADIESGRPTDPSEQRDASMMPVHEPAAINILPSKKNPESDQAEGFAFSFMNANANTPSNFSIFKLF